MPNDVTLDDTLVDNEVGIGVPESVPMPPGAGAATMPMQSQGNAAPPMDSIITDYIISKLGGRGVQGANAAPAPPPPPAVGAPSSPVVRQALEPPMPPPRTGSANAAPIAPSLTPMPRSRPPEAPISVPPPTTGSANASAPPPQPPAPAGPMLRPGSYADIAFNALRGAFTSGPSGAGGGASSGAGSANAAPVGPPISPSTPPTPPTGGGSNPYSAMAPEWLKNALSNAVKYSVGSGGRPDELGALKYSVGSGGRDSAPAAASGRGSANAHPGASTTYPPKDTGATGDEFAARRQQNKIGPPQLESLPKGASSRYTKPYAKGGVYEGQKRPAQKQKRQAPRASAAGSSSSASRGAPASRSQRAAPQTARGGRSAYAQSLIDSMGPRGRGVTTYIEPGTGNEILTGNGMYQNLGKTSTGTSKPSYTKFFDR